MPGLLPGIVFYFLPGSLFEGFAEDLPCAQQALLDLAFEQEVFLAQSALDLADCSVFAGSAFFTGF